MCVKVEDLRERTKEVGAIHVMERQLTTESSQSGFYGVMVCVSRGVISVWAAVSEEGDAKQKGPIFIGFAFVSNDRVSKRGQKHVVVV